MFEFIEPEEQRLYKDRIIPFLKKLAENPTIYEVLVELDQATFLLANDKSNSIQGGALLFNQSTEMLHPRIQEHVRTLYPWMREVWTGMISLQIHQDVTGRDFEKLCKLVCCALMADLIAFGIKETTPFLCVAMTPLEYRSIEMFSINMHNLWDYAVEVKPESDGLFHGILTLIDMNLNAVLPNLLKQRVTIH
ncbi:MAG: hypothetical protein BGO67_00510 [Alphaproteobacteria bacterium 41-28]|nr:MAG: hypothetical protein BGO67_00510 [Alphaproteobacteria bacterium 41-28]